MGNQTPKPWRKERFRALYDKYRSDVWKYCVRRAGSAEAAEEVFNDAFVVAWKNLDSVPEGEEARPWLFTVARNQLRNEWRKSRRYGEFKRQVSHLAPVVVPGDPTQMGSSNTDEILTALGRLTESDAELLKLVAWDQLPYWEIGRVVGCSENTVASRVHRARQRLDKHLQELEQKPPAVSNTSGVNKNLNSCKIIDGEDMYPVTDAQQVERRHDR